MRDVLVPSHSVSFKPASTVGSELTLTVTSADAEHPFKPVPTTV